MERIHQGSNASTEREIENTENQNEASMSNENITQYEPLVYELEILIGMVVPPFSVECRITRIPDRLRQVKEQAYTPTTISIGPIHCFNEKSQQKFQISERYKVQYFKSFISRTKIHLGMLVSTISEMEGRIRSCYEEDTVFLMGRDKFVKLILVDAVFILELFYRYNYNSWEMDDLFLTGQLWIIKSDLVLLENQLPFFVLEKLYNLVRDHYSNSTSLIQLASMFFDCYNVQMLSTENVEIKHFTELMRALTLPLSPSRRMPEMMIVPLLCSATQLKDAGVKFRSISSKRLLELHFDFEKGVLEMPSLVLDDWTEALVRNVMALEQFGHWNALMPSFTEYFIFLDYLVNTIEDINLLCNRGLLLDRRGDNKAALSLVKNLITNISWSGMSSDLRIICERLNEFYQKPVNRLKAEATLSVTTLKNQYFNNRWRGAATLAACLLLLLSLIQTIMSILQVDRA